MNKISIKYILPLLGLVLLYSILDFFSIAFSIKVFHLIVFYTLGGIIFFTRKSVVKWISVPVNTQILPIARVLYGVLCLYSAIQHITLIPSGMEPYNFLVWGLETPSFLAYFLSIVYVLSLLFIIIGYQLRFAWILLFITGGFIIPFSLEIFVKNIFNFYAIFIPASAWLGQKMTKGNEGWPLLLMAFSYAVLMSSAGLFKLLDPVWQEGLGLYYSLNIPFFLPKYLWWILDSEVLMKLLNWLTLLFELLCFPLLLFKKTRVYAFVSLLGLGLFLTFFMEGTGIMGGPIVLVACFAILALTKQPQRLSVLEKINRFLYKGTIKSNSSSKIWLGVFIFWWSVIGVYVNFYGHIIHNFNTLPPKYGNYTVHKKPLFKKDNAFLTITNKIQYSLKKTRFKKAWEFIWVLELFDYHHLFDRVYFRIVFIDAQDKMHEPVQYFDEYGGIDWKQPLPGNEKFLLSAFRMMDGLRTNEFTDKGKLPEMIEKELKALIKYSNNKKEIPYKYVKIQIKQISQPFEYKGNYKDWHKNEWIDFYEYDFKTKQNKVYHNLPTYDYSKLKVKAFENKIITPNF